MEGNLHVLDTEKSADATPDNMAQKTNVKPYQASFPPRTLSSLPTRNLQFLDRVINNDL
jgi:hypothetical protein